MRSFFFGLWHLSNVTTNSLGMHRTQSTWLARHTSLSLLCFAILISLFECLGECPSSAVPSWLPASPLGPARDIGQQLQVSSSIKCQCCGGLGHSSATTAEASKCLKRTVNFNFWINSTQARNLHNEGEFPLEDEQASSTYHQLAISCSSSSAPWPCWAWLRPVCCPMWTIMTIITTIICRTSWMPMCITRTAFTWATARPL